MKTAKVTTVKNDIMRTCVTIDLKAIEEAGGQIERQDMDTLSISFPAVDVGNAHIVTALQQMGLSTNDIDDVMGNLHTDINQRMFKRYIK